MIKLDHIGIAVEQAEAVKTLFRQLLSKDTYKTEDIVSQGVRTHFIDAGTAKLELLESISPDSPVAKFIAKRKEGIHHIAFEVLNIQSTWKRLKRQGFTPLSAPQPGADQKLIFFLHPKETHGMLIEFCQKQRQPLQERYIPFEKGTLAYYELGEEHESSIVVLHGAAGSTHMETEPLIQRLSKKFRVLALDFAGHGKSDAYPHIPFSPDLFIDNVDALFRHLNLAKTHMFGFSLGGFIALAFTHRYPEKVKHLAVHATNLYWNQELIQKMHNRLDHEALKERSQEIAQYLADMHGEDKWVALFEGMKSYTTTQMDYLDTYPGIDKVPHQTLVSAVDKDDLFSVQSPLYLHEHLPNSTLAILPGQRHALQNVDLDQLTPMITRHFTRK